jgi:hypothetical protein
MTEFQYNSARENYLPPAQTSGPASTTLLCLYWWESNFKIEVAPNGIVILSDFVKTEKSPQKLREEDTLADTHTHTHTHTHRTVFVIL